MRLCISLSTYLCICVHEWSHASGIGRAHLCVFLCENRVCECGSVCTHVKCHLCGCEMEGVCICVSEHAGVFLGMRLSKSECVLVFV